MKVEVDLRERTRRFARRIIRLFAAMPRNTAAKMQPLMPEANELVALFASIVKMARDNAP